MNREEETMPRRNGEVQVHVLGNDTIVHDEVSHKVHVLNETARRIWDNCDGLTLKQQVVEELGRLYPDADIDTIRTDFFKTLEGLEKAGVVFYTA